ncbi:chitobiase/beta-hexosaminidase C-terminal domain-containing protein [Flagellimonas sp.]|uniref:chitobiase/beta-hexosaminidase C-terminal domain-containing protein n=1 Tax=Flagellimonas sp. TaxID=2058762 RepID=UPI003B512118
MIKMGARLTFRGIRFLWLGMGCLFLVFAASCQSKKANFLAEDAVHLAPPKIRVDSLLFRNEAQVRLFAGDGESVIHYTLDGSDVGESSPSYKSPFTVSSTKELKVKAFHPRFNPSEVVERKIIKMERDLSGATIKIHSSPNENYMGNGPNTLIDGQKGEFNFRTGKWLGFQEDRIVMDIDFANTIPIQKVMVGLLRDQGAWIFFPSAIEITTSEQIIGKIEIKESGQELEKQMRFVEVPVEKGTYDQITISISPLNEIPEWHPGKGTMPWTFMDEILIE